MGRTRLVTLPVVSSVPPGIIVQIRPPTAGNHLIQNSYLWYWGLNKMAAILQTHLLNPFSLKKKLFDNLMSLKLGPNRQWTNIGWNDGQGKTGKERTYCLVSNIRHLSWQLNCWSLRCSWSIACRRCSNYIFILNLTPGFNGLGKDDCKTRWESFKF